MSWHFSRALVEAFSAATSSAGALSALSSGSPTPQAFLSPDRTTVFSRLSRFGMTFAPLTDELGAAVLTWCQAASHAKTSALRVRAPASTASDPACGPTWRGSLARFDPATSSWRTAQPSLLGDSDECSVTWPRSGMTAGGQCWELPMSKPPTSGTASGLWRTPNSAVVEPKSTVVKLSGRKPTDPQVGLADQVIAAERGEFFPTPCTVDSGSYFNRSASPGAALRPTLGAMAKVDLWPTPTSTLGTNGGRVTPTKAREGGTLIEALSARTTWATPVRRDYRHPGRSRMDRTGSSAGDPLPQQVGGALNPTWVEWLMGWPLGWTDLKPLATDKSPCAPQPPSACSRPASTEAMA